MTATSSATDAGTQTALPRLLIEDWLPAAAIGVECMREEGSLSAKPPTKYFHVWWARRPLTASRAAVLASLLPADFSHEAFERLLGFGRPGEELVEIRRLMDSGYQVPGGFNCDRAFKRPLPAGDLEAMRRATGELWSGLPTVMDPMAGGGSIPFEAARLGFEVLANDYNPVASSILEATVRYPTRFGRSLFTAARKWATTWVTAVESQLVAYYPQEHQAQVHAYIYAHTVATPDKTHYQTPLVPDWHLANRSSGLKLAAEPIVDKQAGTWTVRTREVGDAAGQLITAPPPTYKGGKGISLFNGELISAEYIKAEAQAGRMGSALYAVALKTPTGLTFRGPEQTDLNALAAAHEELMRRRPSWEATGVIPTERIPEGDKTREPMQRGMTTWAGLFSDRQLLCMGTLVEQLNSLRPRIIASEGLDLGEAIFHRHEKAGKGFVMTVYRRRARRADALERVIRGLHFGSSPAALEHDSALRPLSPLDPALHELIEQLTDPGERLPLVVELQRAGSFSCASIRWVGPDADEPVWSLDRLNALLQTWDGKAPLPERWVAARASARSESETRLSALQAEATTRERAGIERQLAAARLRLLRELGRFLSCRVGSADDLNGALYAGIQERSASGDRLRRCWERLGGSYPEWEAELGLVTELRRFIAGLTTGRREARLTGAEVDAALNDPRWQAILDTES